MLALFPSLTADSITKSNVLKDSDPSVNPLFPPLQHPPVVALRLPPANGFDPPGKPVRTAAGAGRQETGDSPREDWCKIFSAAIEHHR